MSKKNVRTLNCLVMLFAFFMASHLLLPNLGLTCTEQNFITKAGAQRTASELGVLIVAPDTSPRKFTIYKFDNGIERC